MMLLAFNSPGVRQYSSGHDIGFIRKNPSGSRTALQSPASRDGYQSRVHMKFNGADSGRVDVEKVMGILNDISARELKLWPDVRLFDNPANNLRRIEEWAQRFPDVYMTATAEPASTGNAVNSAVTNLPASKHPQLGSLLGSDKQQRPRAIFFYDGG